MASGFFGDEIYVSTDDEKIRREAEKAGARIIDRPARISQDKTPMLPVIQHANTVMNADCITLLQPTNPLRLPWNIADAVACASKSEWISNLVVCSAYKGSYYPAGLYQPTSNRRRQNDDGNYISGLVYVFSAKSLCCWPVEVNCLFDIIHRWQAHELDEIDDWNICEYLFKERILKDVKARDNC